MSASNAPKPVLSVAIIARDAEPHIADTIGSVSGIADEILLMDTGSTDRTREIARAQGAAVEFVEWQDDFSGARNHAMRRARGQWILWIDAGETIDAAAAESIRQYAETHTGGDRACMMLVESDPPTPHVSTEQVGQIRLVPNRPELVYQGRVRETLKHSLATCGITVDGLPCTIRCSADRHDPMAKQRRAERNLQLVQLETNLDGPRPELHVIAGECYADLNEANTAADEFRRAIKYAERGSTTQLEAYYGLLTVVDAATSGKKSAALHTCLEALEIFPLDAQLLCALGSYLQAEGRLDLATRAYQTAIRHGELNPETWHLSDLRQISVICLAVTLKQQDKQQQAWDVLEAALAENPRYDLVRSQLIDQYVVACREKEALALVRDMADPGYPRKLVRDTIRGAIAAIGKDWNRALELLQPAFMGGCRSALCLRYLTLVLFASGNPAVAEPVLDAWRQSDPDSGELPHYEAALAELRTTKADANDTNQQLRVDPAQANLRGMSFPTVAPTSQPPAHR
ncbi:MAG: glycosyltransferase [Pirellulales bacterium]|nr:glycosyltransferase [Pirellulales bacterium]